MIFSSGEQDTVQINRESGIALLQILALCLILPALLLYMQTHASSVLTQKQLIRHAQSQRRLALRALESPQQIALEGIYYSCQNSPEQNAFQVNLCWIQRNSLFSNPAGSFKSVCAQQDYSRPGYTRAGRILSASSLSSQHLCRGPFVDNGRVVSNSNIEIEHPGEVESIFSAGYVEIKEVLSVSTSILIEAGGDIFIDSLDLNQNSRVYLLSHSGSIVLANGSHFGEVCAEAAGDVYAFRPYKKLASCGVGKRITPFSLKPAPNRVQRSATLH